MSASDYLELELLDHVFGAAAYSAPETIYLSLHSDDPGEDGSNELSGGSYARVAVTNNDTNFPAASSGSKNLHVAFSFPEASGDWSAATYFGTWDASTAGNFLVGGPLDDSKTVETGDTATFAIDALAITMA